MTSFILVELASIEEMRLKAKDEIAAMPTVIEMVDLEGEYNLIVRIDDCDSAEVSKVAQKMRLIRGIVGTRVLSGIRWKK